MHQFICFSVHFKLIMRKPTSSSEIFSVCGVTELDIYYDA